MKPYNEQNTASNHYPITNTAKPVEHEKHPEFPQAFIEINRAILANNESKPFVKIDFTRPLPIKEKYSEPSVHSLPGEIETVQIPPEIMQIFGKHYAHISTILGLNTVPDEYIFVLTKALGKSDGKHVAPKDGNPGYIYLNRILLTQLSAKYNEAESDELKEFYLDEIYIETVKFLGLLAHEQYHKRQSILFRNSYENKLKRYIKPEEDYDRYKAQIIEIGADSFENKYIKFILSNLDPNDGSREARAIRKVYGKKTLQRPVGSGINHHITPKKRNGRNIMVNI